MKNEQPAPVAYFSAEFGLSDKMPIFAGGLGILAGDILKEAADSNLPMIGVGLFYHHGFFRQRITKEGKQESEGFTVHPRELDLEEVLDPQTGEPLIIELNFPAEPVEIRVWKKVISPSLSKLRITDYRLPITLYLLDAALPQNEPFEVEYTGSLYQGDWAPKLNSEIVLGVGGVRLLRHLGIKPSVWHLNDDHAALSFLERIAWKTRGGVRFQRACAEVKNQSVFTTHTPVPGAVSAFGQEEIRPHLEALFLDSSDEVINNLLELGQDENGSFNFTVLALRMARKINGVSLRHGQVANSIWQNYLGGQLEGQKIQAITNGVHTPTWISEPMDRLYRKYLGKDYLQAVDSCKSWQIFADVDTEGVSNLKRDLWNARLQCKQNLVDKLPELVPEELRVTDYGLRITPNTLFLGFARRFAPYKQADILIYDLDRLAEVLTNKKRPVYLFISGKAHYSDPVGQEILAQILAAAQDERVGGHIFFLENYGIKIAKVLIPGVDVWLNVPQVPMEASSTSGMKALYNGALNASIADGWWWEVENGAGRQESGFRNQDNAGDNTQENALGFTIGLPNPPLPPNLPTTKKQTAEDLYDLLENEIAPLFYQRTKGVPVKWLEMVKNALVQLGPRFNTKRMLQEYRQKLYG